MSGTDFRCAPARRRHLPFSGPVAPDGRVQRASIVPTWAGVNIREVFEPVLERPIFADNESNCAAIAEMTWGAAVDCEDFVMFKIDIGVGGAIVSHGRVLTGIAGAGGEFGHMTIDPRGRSLPLRQSRLPRTHRQPQPGHRGRLAPDGPRNRPPTSWSRCANAGDVGCARLIADTAEIAGRGLGMIGAIINPGLIVVGGRAAFAGAVADGAADALPTSATP